MAAELYLPGKIKEGYGFVKTKLGQVTSTLSGEGEVNMVARRYLGQELGFVGGFIATNSLAYFQQDIPSRLRLGRRPWFSAYWWPLEAQFSQCVTGLWLESLHAVGWSAHVYDEAHNRVHGFRTHLREQLADFAAASIREKPEDAGDSGYCHALANAGVTVAEPQYVPGEEQLRIPELRSLGGVDKPVKEGLVVIDHAKDLMMPLDRRDWHRLVAGGRPIVIQSPRLWYRVAHSLSGNNFVCFNFGCDDRLVSPEAAITVHVPLPNDGSFQVPPQVQAFADKYKDWTSELKDPDLLYHLVNLKPYLNGGAA